MIPLSVARYRLDFTVESPMALPAFAGSALRGIFGSSLREAACVTRKSICDGCGVLTTCPYAQVFEPRPPAGGHALQDFSQIPRPYVIEPPPWGERTYARGEMLSFHLVLAGRALAQLPLILFAFARAFQRGLRSGGGRAALAQVVHCDGAAQAVIVAGPDAMIVAHDTTPPAAPPAASAASLHFEVPLRLQANGQRATVDEFTPRRLISALVRRIALIAEFHGGGPLALDFKALAARAETLVGEKDLRWRDWARHSSRQDRTMPMGGVIGRWTLRGDLAPFMPFLHLGQWLHVGKDSVFGMGGYRLELHD